MKMLRPALKQIAVVIPCYNEAASIESVIVKLPRAELLGQGLALHVFVINNNSTDNTAAIARKVGATVIFEPKKGKGNALRTGFKSLPADIDYVVMLDGDDTYRSEEILRMIEPLRTGFCDVVVGSRLSGHIHTAAMSTLNRFGNWLFTMLVRNLYGANVTDVLTGYFAWKRPVLNALGPHITSSGFAIEMEMITKMARLGYRMASVPISYDLRRGESSLHPLTDGSRILVMLLRNLIWRPVLLSQIVSQEVTTNLKSDFVPRKIVFVSDSIYPYMKGGKEKRLYEIARRLVTIGHEVHIYTMHWWADAAVTRTEGDVTLHALCKHHEMYRGDRRAIAEAVAFGFACFKLLRVKFDVLDVDHMPFFPIFSTWIVCKLRGRKLHATWHEALSRREWVSYMGVGGILAAVVERLSTWLPHSITAASAQTKELLASTHGRSKRVALVASGIDATLLNSIVTADTRCDVLYVGRLVKDKHVEQLIDAIGIIAQHNTTVRSIVIGQGPELGRLKERVAKQGLQNNVTFLEPLPEATDVYSYMRAAKVFCSPSVREGFGIVSLEALGCGTPVVTVDDPGNAARHLVQDGHNGSVVALRPQALAEAIEYWMSKAQKPDTAVDVAEYDWHQLAQQQAKAYLL